MIDLTQLNEGQSAKVISIEGGAGINKRIQDMGIREGSIVTKVTRLFSQGPVVVKAGRTQVALGRGMASKIMVEPLEK
ncbi:MAG: ferrous iron transport protein A [Candidatus Omnitrophota bacterium]|nr:MAG: ferrous iron transport protein A [Candidatus Omnitrophota bacterium]